MRLRLLLLCLLLVGCAREPKEWTRPDGKPINPAQLELDKTACKGEVSQDMRVFKGCMASRGYLAATAN
jgi:hypothetical protein